MPAPENTFKKRLLAGETLIGCWLSFGEAAPAEIMGSAGFDWLLIDGEHGPNDLRSIRDQLMALESSSSTPVVRVPIGLDWVIKQVLDIGAQTILVPMVDTAEQAAEIVRACRYPPAGCRGVGAAAARSGRFGGIPDYVPTADDQICILIQVESVKGVENLDEILQVEGIDGVFIGPADLSSDMGFRGNSKHPDAKKAVCDALTKIAASAKAAGCLSLDDDTAQMHLDSGSTFQAVGIDVHMMINTARASVAKYKS